MRRCTSSYNDVGQAMKKQEFEMSGKTKMRKRLGCNQFATEVKSTLFLIIGLFLLQLSVRHHVTDVVQLIPRFLEQSVAITDISITAITEITQVAITLKCIV